MADSRLIKPTLQADLLYDLLEGAENKGVEIPKILEIAGVNPDILQNRKTRISLQLYYRILSTVREYLQDEMLGFFDTKIHPRAFPVLCEAATGYPTFEAVIMFANNFYSLITDEFRWVIERDSTGSKSMLSIRFKNPISTYKRFIIEFLMVTTYRFVGWLIGANYPLSSVYFTFKEPPSVEKYHYLLSGHIFFEANQNGLVFDSGALTRPVIRNRQEVPAFLHSSVGWFLLNPEMYPYTRQVRQQLTTKEIASGFPGFEVVARALNISHQHLWRKLNNEGTSYQMIKNQLRRDMSIHFLINTNNTIQEISEKVGYSAERPFYRMFSQWTGMTPGKYRRIFKPGRAHATI